MNRHLSNIVLSITLLSSWFVSTNLAAAATIFPHTRRSTWKYALPIGGYTNTVIASGPHHIAHFAKGFGLVEEKVGKLNTLKLISFHVAR
ncbi:MAG: hypothetical protein ACP5O1_02105 [Phycisphaerae bacterium]